MIRDGLVQKQSLHDEESTVVPRSPGRLVLRGQETHNRPVLSIGIVSSRAMLWSVSRERTASLWPDEKVDKSCLFAAVDTNQDLTVSVYRGDIDS